MIQCLICKAYVQPAEQAEHMAYAHPEPDGGFKFYMDGQLYTWDKPSELVGTLRKRFAPGSLTYTFYEDRNGEMIPFSAGNAVDLTRFPHFCNVPPATMFKSHP